MKIVRLAKARASFVENMQKSVNQLAAVVGAVNQVTPSPALSVATTSRRSVDIDSLDFLWTFMLQ